LLWITCSSGLAIRDLWLVAHGGGVTPSWLLRAETTAFSLSATSGLAALTSMSRGSDRAEVKSLKTAANAKGVAAVVMHGVRLAIYLGAARDETTMIGCAHEAVQRRSTVPAHERSFHRVRLIGTSSATHPPASDHRP